MNKDKIINKITINKIKDGISSPKSIIIYNNNKSLIEDSKTINNEIVEIPIGRLTPGLELENNNYLSKNQIELNINKNNQTINFIVKGVNPTYLKSKDNNNNDNSSKEIKDILGKELETNVSYSISNGDILSFLLPSQTTSILFSIDLLDSGKEDTQNKRKLDSSNNNDKDIVNKKNNIDNNNSSNKQSQPQKEIKQQQPKQPNQSRSGWADKLLVYCDSPKENGALYYDDKIVIINDKFPKSKYHFLVLPRKHILKHKDIQQSDSELLEYMFKIGNQFLKDKIPLEDKSTKFLIGFHAIPSMLQLHMHMISNDFQSPSLKTKEHWNSFTTEFFVPFDSFYQQIKSKGSFNINVEHFKKLKDKSLTCCICDEIKPTIPQIKSHYLECLNNQINHKL